MTNRNEKYEKDKCGNNFKIDEYEILSLIVIQQIIHLLPLNFTNQKKFKSFHIFLIQTENKKLFFSLNLILMLNGWRRGKN